MISLDRNKKQDSLKWLREAERPPRNYFEISAITEGIQWHDDIQTRRYDCLINKKHCIVEWAARLMIRSAHLSKHNEEGDANVLSRSHELVWCKRATDMALPRLALQCIKRNTVDLYDNETLSWLEQKVDALKVMGLKLNDSQLLRKALDTADKYTPLFQESSTQESILHMKCLVAELSYKLQLLTPTKLETLSSEVALQYDRLDTNTMSHETRKRLQDLFATSILFYDDLFRDTTEKSLQNAYIKSMTSTIRRSLDLKLELNEGFLAILFNNLKGFHSLDADGADCLKELVTSLLKTKQTQFLHLLRSKLPSYLPNDASYYGVGARKYSLCLQLVADPDYTLLRYCHELKAAGRNADVNQYDKLFSRMKQKIFENPYVGTDYQPLLKYKTQLYQIENLSTEDSTITQSILESVIKELENKRPISTLRLSQLCPALTDFDVDNGLKELLGLNEDVVKFEEQIQVYIDSIGRPCLLTAILKNGCKVKFIVKQADMWQASAALTVAGSYPVAYEGYRIIPLSEDCGLIQFLENHVRLRDLISKHTDIDVPIARQSRKEDELILPPTQTSVANYNQICTKIPPYVLRSAVENTCISVQEFIHKKNIYLNTLCTMTVFNCMFGLGDRHLANIMYDTQNGGIQCIDLDELFKYGVNELPPARLTRNLLSLIDTTVLESRLQTKMAAIRECHRFLTAVMKFCFQSDDRNFIEKLPYIEATLKGTMLSHEITKEVIKNSNKKYKDKYIQLLEDIFEDFESKHQYTVEEQISNLLLHSTDPRILSIVRTEWEPWI